MTPMLQRASTIVVLALLACCLQQASAVCCKRQGNSNCCGNGKCNLFCCNCDRGCDKKCESTRCNTGEWLKCAAAVGKCSVPCGASMTMAAAPACVACMGTSYTGCKKCYSSGSRRLLATTPASVLQSRNDFYTQVARGHTAITQANFEVWLQQAHINATRGVPAAEMSGRLTPEQVFKR